VTRAEALSHAAAVVRATDLPVSADLENCFADDLSGVGETVAGAVGVGLAGCSIEDATGHDSAPIYPVERAVERVAAAVEAAAGRLVITARAENFLYGRHDAAGLADTIARLQRYQEAGAHVLYAPGLRTAEEIRTVVQSVDRPVNVLAVPGVPPVADLADLGVARISVGGAFAYAALAGLVDAAHELLDRGTYEYLKRSGVGRAAVGRAFT
jgi:2-methylisocitrate lyase-like PEP mutase family enzyme